MNALGEAGCLHFIDVNRGEQTFNLPFAKQIKKCDDSLRQIEAFEQACQTYGIKIETIKSKAEFQSAIVEIAKNLGKSQQLMLEPIQLEVEKRDAFIKGQTNTLKELSSALQSLIEKKCILSVAGQIIRGDKEMR